MEKVIQDILKERQRQNDKWGEQNHSPFDWMPILMEELGEASKEAVDWRCDNPVSENGVSRKATYDDRHKRLLDYRKELIQLAAVTIQAIESFDRNFDFK
ncbi:MAG: hypothetical protein AAF242_00185 [Bacteroidota bacterium]